MEFSLENRREKAALLAGALAISALVIFQAGKLWLGDLRIHSSKIEQMERGAALLPGDGEAWDRLGHFYEWDLMQSDLPRALADYQRAVSDDPLSADYRMDMANALETGGDAAGAERAFEQAQALYPASGEVAFHYGNFLLREQKYAEANAELRRAVAADPTLLPLAISRAWRASGDVNELLDQVLPANVDAYLQALDYFAAIRQADPALVVWKRIQGTGKFVALGQTFPLLDELIREDRADDARRVWSEALAAAGLPNDEPTNGSVIWNGTFDSDFEEGGLGWRWNPLDGASIDFDMEPAPGGGRAVRLDFSGDDNITLDAPAEYAAVEPNRRYHFHAEIRTSNLSTESGVRFAIVDPNHAGAVNFASDNFTGTQAWTSIDSDITTGSETHFLQVRVNRPPSRLFDNKLSGTAWIADVWLIPADGSTGAGGANAERGPQ